MQIKALFAVATCGILLGMGSVVFYNEKIPAQPPLAISYNPYESGVYAVGIIEGEQPTGTNIDVFPEVAGTVTSIHAKEGQIIKQGEILMTLEDSVQTALVSKDIAQVALAKASLATAQDQLHKFENAYRHHHAAVSRNDLDNARNSVKSAQENVMIATKQLAADQAILNKYTIVAPVDAKVIRIATAVGNYVSARGGYDSYTQTLLPPIQLIAENTHLVVRCFLNEILAPKLPATHPLEATLFIRGLNNQSVPLTFVELQPYTQPSIRLNSGNRTRIDARALPILFKFSNNHHPTIYPGQFVDVYIKT